MPTTGSFLVTNKTFKFAIFSKWNTLKRGHLNDHGVQPLKKVVSTDDSKNTNVWKVFFLFFLYFCSKTISFALKFTFCFNGDNKINMWYRVRHNPFFVCVKTFSEAKYLYSERCSIYWWLFFINRNMKYSSDRYI